MIDYAVWRPAFADAIDRRFYTIEYLDWLVSGGGGSFWPGSQAAIVTEFKSFPSGARAICGVVAAGDLDEIVEVLIPAAEAWGHQRGCTFAMIESRPGWARQLKSSGYAPHQLTIVKEL